MQRLAVIVTRGTTNHLAQVVTLLMAAVHSELAVRVLFRDESVAHITADGIARVTLSPTFQSTADAYVQRLKKHDLFDLRRALSDIKASGDVKLYACSSSMALAGIAREALIPEIDEVRGLPAFLLEDMAAADRVLTF